MKCANHEVMDAVFTCGECGRPFCGQCAVEIGGEAFCKPCLQGIVERTRSSHAHHPLRKLIAALLSIIPGAGHMFLGQIGKGFTMMAALFAAVFLIILYSDSTGMYWMTAYLIPTLCVLFVSYAVFDSMAIAEGGRGDSPSSEDDTLKLIWDRMLGSRRTIAWVLVVAGAVGVLNIFSAPLQALSRTYLSVEVPLAGFVLPVILLAGGLYMLRKSRKRGP